MNMNGPLFTSHNQLWRTPKAIYDELNFRFEFDFDPCPTDPHFDGLSVEWEKSNFCNPPYRNIAKWIKKGWEEFQKGKTVVFLIPSRTDTKWWHEYCMKADSIRFIKGRIRFEGAKENAPFPSAIVIFGKEKNGKRI